MSKIIQGKVFILEDNIDTDQIIPTNHLLYSMKDPGQRLNYGKYALSGLPVEKYKVPFVQDNGASEYSIIVAGKNFGCGSSREQAPASLQIAGVQVVLAQSYARIFYRNVIDAAFLIPLELKNLNKNHFLTGDLATVDLETGVITNQINGESLYFYPLGDAQYILEAGGIFAYARKKHWIQNGLTPCI